MNKKSREKIKELIRRIAKEYGVNEELAVRVAECESGLDPNAVNVNPGGSIDRGLYQWNSWYHPEITNSCAFYPECATIEFCKAVKAGHLSWWNATRHCWKPALKKTLLIRIRDTLQQLVNLFRRLLEKLKR